MRISKYYRDPRLRMDFRIRKSSRACVQYVFTSIYENVMKLNKKKIFQHNLFFFIDLVDAAHSNGELLGPLKYVKFNLPWLDGRVRVRLGRRILSEVRVCGST